MPIIVATDIFGRTKHLESMFTALSPGKDDVQIIDPYQGQRRNFQDEQEAYETYLEECGHDEYLSLLQSVLTKCSKPATIIAFSAGASAAWRAVAGKHGNRAAHLIGFYPGQIRHHLETVPGCPATLIFPCREDHFDVETVIGRLASIPDVLCLKSEFLHGFMNPLSRNYSESGYTIFSQAMTRITALPAGTSPRQVLNQAVHGGKGKQA